MFLVPSCVLVMMVVRFPQCIFEFCCVSCSIPQNCPRTYNLLAFDPDGDRVRCRYGNQLHTECTACRRHSGFTLDEVRMKNSLFPDSHDRMLVDICLFVLMPSGRLHLEVPVHLL